MNAYIIMLNDYPKLVVLDDLDKAKQMMEQLSDEFYKRNGRALGFATKDDYLDRMNWHIQIVRAE